MKIICGERVLDMDRMNAVKPDGAHIWTEVRPFTYDPGSLPEDRAGTYLLTSDNGAVSIRDVAFKILFDMCAWAGSGSTKYLMREIARGAERSGWDLVPVPEGTAMRELYDALGLESVAMPDCSKTIRSNLPALRAACDLDDLVGGMLSDYIYVDGQPFTAIYMALSELLASFDMEDFVMFVEGVYGVLSMDPDELRKRTAPEQAPDPEPDAKSGPEPVGNTDAVPAPVSDRGLPPAPDGMVGPDEASPANGMSVRDMPRGVLVPGGTGLFSSGRRLKGSDLTGTDETYTLDYYAQFYKQAMAQADSEGFADRLIRARAGDGVAPIAILEEAVSKLKSALDTQGSGRALASGLKGQLMQLAGSISEAAGKLEALEELGDQPAKEAAPAQPGGQAQEAEESVSGPGGAQEGKLPATSDDEAPVPAADSEAPVPAAGSGSNDASGQGREDEDPAADIGAPAPGLETNGGAEADGAGDPGDGVEAPDIPDYDEDEPDYGSREEDGPPEDPDDEPPEDT